jgi:prepilin-type processing-associated H-X9-DG protein/prepilin-type N-terminal cleavage/methylation domain-containing protein
MPIADCRLPNGKRIGLRPNAARGRAPMAFLLPCINQHSEIGNRKSAFTLIEMLVVIGIIAALAAMLTVVIVSARHLSLRTECQENLKHIGQAVTAMALNDSGGYPQLCNAYPSPSIPNDSGFPWWARVFEHWEGDMGLLFARNADSSSPNFGQYLTTGNANGLYTANGPVDNNFNPNGHVLTAQLYQTPLPQAMKGLRCPMGGALDETTVANLFNSISYGLNFDVMCFGDQNSAADRSDAAFLSRSDAGKFYSCQPGATTLAYGPRPNPYDVRDKQPDRYYVTDIRHSSEFILVSEASTQDSNLANWTGGRISMNAINRTTSDSLPSNAPIVGRHGGYANVLFADGHVDVVEVAPGQGASRNINMNTPLWTLPGQ